MTITKERGPQRGAQRQQKRRLKYPEGFWKNWVGYGASWECQRASQPAIWEIHRANRVGYHRAVKRRHKALNSLPSNHPKNSLPPT